jgi:hypothetical protein
MIGYAYQHTNARTHNYRNGTQHRLPAGVDNRQLASCSRQAMQLAAGAGGEHGSVRRLLPRQAQRAQADMAQPAGDGGPRVRFHKCRMCFLGLSERSSQQFCHQTRRACGAVAIQRECVQQPTPLRDAVGCAQKVLQLHAIAMKAAR